MSFQATHWAIHEVHGVPNKLVLVVMAEYADENGECFPSQDRLARDTDLSVSTVRRTIRAYEALGLVASVKRYVMSEDGSKVRTSNLYRLAIGAQPATTTTPEPVDNLPQDLPVNLTGRGEPVDNSTTGSGLFVENTATGQSDRKGVPTGQIEGGYRSRVTGISTPKHQIEPPDLTEPNPESHQAVTAGPVGSGPVGAVAPVAASPATASGGVRVPAQADGGLSVAEIGLIATCLPAWAQALDGPGAVEVAGLLAERVAAGWEPEQIRELLAAAPPAQVGRMASLVAWRIRNSVIPDLAPARLPRAAAGAQAEGLRRREQAAAERARSVSEALAEPAASRQADPDPGAWEAALAEARRRLPTAGRMEVSVEAWRILTASRQVSGGEAA